MTPPTGLTRDAGWQIGVSKTLPCAAKELWRLLLSPTGLPLWLGTTPRPAPERGSPYRTAEGTEGEVRGWHEGTRIRLTHHPRGGHETTVQLTLTPRPHGTQLRFHQERLRSAEERQSQRHHWRQVLDQIAQALPSPSGQPSSTGRQG
ncbi:SRPBCC domain-containing protein [Streptomyces sp. NPDC005438]|uniref:SRPBCC family protein n=1 Tax=Streptomyces sp. NPDC005438 TaxID=3156880 RepID=UPI0033B2209B